MILFENYYVLGLLPILFVLWMILFHRQSAALDWIGRNVSGRFRSQFTVYGKVSMPLHLSILLFTGVLLILACAGPYVSGQVEEKTKSGDVVLVLDASLSMLAKDARSINGRKVSRLVAARERAGALINSFPHHRFAIMSFSGLTVVHAPLTRDHYGVHDALGSLTTHGYQQMGSSLKGALTRLLTLSADSEHGVQAIIFSDGELPRPEKYDEELAALAARKIRVHTVSLGSRKGVRLKIYDPEQVRRGVRRPAVVKTVTSRRLDKHLKRIASRTDGEFTLGATRMTTLRKALEAGSRADGSIMAAGKKDLSLHFLVGFLILFLLEILTLEHILRRMARAEARKTKPGLRGSLVHSVLLLTAFAPLFVFFQGCEVSAWKAHALNEKGLTKHGLRRFDSARGDFERSAAYRVKEEVPTYNLANGRLKKGKFKKAHKIYERALRMRPDLAPAFFNDGIALYRWGNKELDAQKCRFKRTKRLWQAALVRFRHAMRINYEQERDGPLGDRARLNADHVVEQLKKLAQLEKKCAAQNKKKPDQNKSDKNKSKKNTQDKKNKPDNKKDKNKDPDNKKKGNQKQKKPRLGDKEKEKVSRALKRIRRERRGKKFQQSKQQQIRGGKPGGKKGGGSVILW